MAMTRAMAGRRATTRALCEVDGSGGAEACAGGINIVEGVDVFALAASYKHFISWRNAVVRCFVLMVARRFVFIIRNLFAV